MVDDDGPLPLARRRLVDAVHALADPIPVWDGGTCRWSDPLYVRLRQAMQSQRGGYTRIHSSKLPCRVDVLALLIEVDGTVTRWTPEEKVGTVERLRSLTARGWRPQDCSTIDEYCGQLERWVLAGTDLLDPAPVVHVRQTCPRCGARFAHRRDGAGELVNVRALRVSENGCTCSACGAFWPPEQFHWLAQLLGCEALPA
ncbi:MAG: hypothetical protein ACM4D3_18300 [Candidatus Sericytochromatia bacterium]